MSPSSHAVFGRTLVLVFCFSLGQSQQQSQTEVEAQEVAQAQGPIVYHARIRPGQANQGANVAAAATEAPEIEAPEVGQDQPASSVVQAGGPNSPGGTVSTYPPNYEYEAPETPEVTSPLPTTGTSAPATPRKTVRLVPRIQPSYNQQQTRGAAASVSVSVQSKPTTSGGSQHHQTMTQAANAAKTNLMRNLFEQFRKMAEYHQYDLQKMRAAMQPQASSSVSAQRGPPVYDAGHGSRQTSPSGQSGPSVYDAGQGSMQSSTSGQSGPSVYDAGQGSMQSSTSGQSGPSVYDAPAPQGSMQSSTSGQSGPSVYDAGQGSMQSSTSGQSGPSVYDAGQGSMQSSTPSPIWVPVYVAGQWTKQKYNPGQTEAPAYAVAQGNMQTSGANQKGYGSSTGTQTSSQPFEQTTAAFQIGGQYSDASGAQPPVNDQTGAQTTTSAPIQAGAQTPAPSFQIVEHFSEVYSGPKSYVSGQTTTQTAPVAGQDKSAVTDKTPVVPVKAAENSVNAKLSHPLEPRLSPVPYTDPYTSTGNILEPISNAEFGAIMQRMLIQRLRKYMRSQRKFSAYNPVP